MNENADLAAALGAIPSGLFVLTAGQGDLATGMLASWVQQCSFDPPQVTVAIRRDRPISDLLMTPGLPFAINVVPAGDIQLLKLFGKGAGRAAFAALEQLDGYSVPVLARVAASIVCEMVRRHAAGDHDLLVGTVIHGLRNESASPAIHVRKNGMNY